MRPTRWRWLAVVAAGTGLATWAILKLLRTHVFVPQLASWAVCIVLLCVAGAVLTAGWPVRRYLRDPRGSRIDPLRAARAAALGKSAALGGAALVGFYGAQAVIEATAQVVAANPLVSALAATACSVVLAIVGMIVESFCKLPPPTDGQAARSTRGDDQPDPA